MISPKISIIIPVYNVEKYLAECLDSCINQTLEDIEIICVDDCSTDGSYEILEEYQNKDPRIKIVRQETNKKQGAARNKGLEVATGEYIWFVDSDDYVDTKACQILYDTIKEFDVDMLCFSALQFVNTDKNYTFSNSKFFQGVQINKIYHPKTNWKEINFSNLCITPWAYLTKRHLIQNFRFREGVVFEDVDFSSILLASVNSFCYIPYTAYFYRTNFCSTTQTAISKKKLEDWIEVAVSLDEFISKNKTSKQHFLFKQLINILYYDTNLSTSISNSYVKPSNFNLLFSLQQKYYKYKTRSHYHKYSLKRFIGKVLKRIGLQQNEQN